MDLESYGPFAYVVAVAAALAVSYSLLLAKSVGRYSEWTWLARDTPKILLKTTIKAPAFVLIILTFTTINKGNYLIFAIFAVISAASVVCLAICFQKYRFCHETSIPKTGPDGNNMYDENGNPLETIILIGSENDMLPQAKCAYLNARIEDEFLSVTRFMSGFIKPNNPEEIWSKETLANVRTKLSIFVMAIILTAIMTLYLAASIVGVILSLEDPGADSTSISTILP